MTETKYEWHLPLVIHSPNRRVHWTKKHREDKQIEKVIRLSCKDIKKIKLPCRVTLTRCSSGSLDWDNNVASMKKSRDVIADMLIPGKAPGQADSDERIRWFYGQKRTKRYGLIIEIEEL